MRHVKSQVRGLAGALILAAALAACDDGMVRVTYSTEDKGLNMPVPELATREKCYGIAKAQYNDGTAGCDDCAGTALKDYMTDTWKYMPTGQCLGMGGSLVDEMADDAGN